MGPITLVAPLVETDEGPKPDLPEGLVGSRWTVNPEGQTATVELAGPAHLVAAIGLYTATDPISQAIRAALRQSLKRFNDFAIATGHPELVETEGEAIDRLAQSLRDGGGLPEPPEPEES